jgi:hypothetical protein
MFVKEIDRGFVNFPLVQAEALIKLAEEQQINAVSRGNLLQTDYSIYWIRTTQSDAVKKDNQTDNF